MKFNSKYKTVLLVSSFTAGVLVVLTQFAFAGYYEQLTPDEQALIRKGGQVVRTQDVDGDPWPQYTVYQKVNATPFETAAVFADFDRHQEFFPGIVSSKVTESQPGGRLTLKYHLKKLGQTDETLVSEWVHRADSGYRVDWRLLSSHLAEKSDGFAAFESMGNAGESTLVVYSNLVVPNSSIPSFLLGIFKKKVEGEVKDSVSALLGRVRSVKADSNSSADPTRAKLLTQEEEQLTKLTQ